MRESDYVKAVLVYEFNGEKFRHDRIRIGFTLTETAHKAGITPAFLSDLEKGKRNCSGEVLRKLVIALHGAIS